MQGRKRRGFTLAELLIVVAIIAVLIAIAIPVFGSMLDKAKERVCLANLTSSQHIVTLQRMIEPGLTAEQALELIAQSVGEPDALCPAGGRYKVETESADASGLVVLCSIHGKTAVQIVNEQIAALTGAAKSYFAENSARKELDSTGPNFGADIKKELAEQLGTTLDYDFRIWRQTANSDFVVYVFEPVDGKKAGDTVAATRYVFDKGWNQKGEPQKGAAPLVEKTTDDRTGKPVKHLVLNAEQFKQA